MNDKIARMDLPKETEDKIEFLFPDHTKKRKLYVQRYNAKHGIKKIKLAKANQEVKDED